MTREEAKELLPIIQAFAEGKKIEYSTDGKNWSETETPIWDNYSIYRVKPEPKYCPFKSKEECWNEMLKHQPFGWIKAKTSGSARLIGKVYMSWIVCVTDETGVYSASDLFNNYTFADGKSFGIKEE